MQVLSCKKVRKEISFGVKFIKIPSKVTSVVIK